MFQSSLRFAAGALVLSLLSSSAYAHFLWLVPDPPSGEVRVFFSEGAAPDDPELLDRLEGLKLWRFEGRDQATQHDAERRDDALVTALGKAHGVALSHRYGVLERGGEAFALHYHGTSQVSPLPGTWKRLGGEKVDLEIVPAQKGKEMVLTLLWKGEPVSDAQIVVGGAGIEAKEGKTDQEGRFSVEPQASGLLTVRARHVESESGKLDGKEYASVRHWTTLTVPVSVPTMQSLDVNLPDVPQGITSFGAAGIGDHVYVYGGHLGGAHHYWKEGQSNELLRLNVREGGKWEKLASGPRRTGTAMVSHGAKLYRIGGFEANNAESDDAVLHSMNDAERYDPASNRWDQLPAMPVPRSSHDAAMLGDVLYVVGGWNLQAGRDGQFLDTMLTLDLSSEAPEWKSHSVPFKRRAVSIAAFQGKLYVMGGMQEAGGPTTRVDVFDPASGTWSEGPSLHGAALEGFGTTSFEIGGKLTTITHSGAIQQLAADGKSWLVGGQLKHPRFFARLLPIEGNRGIAIAGADMATGKVTATEVIGEK
jgi:N-acetylneuraminic acid mutarotase